MNDFKKIQNLISNDEEKRLENQSQYTQARKVFEPPILRMESKDGQFSQDNFKDGYNIVGWAAMKKTPKDKLLESRKLKNPWNLKTKDEEDNE